MSSKRSKKQRRRGSKISKTSERTLKPRLGDFKRRRIEDESIDQISNTQNVGRMRRVGQGARSLRTRQMNNIFDDFRNSIESMLNPSFSPWRYSPSTSRIGVQEDEVRVPVYDVVDRGDKYEVTVELPGIDKDNIRINAMDDSIEISAEQSRNKDERKKEFSYSQRTFSSFYCTIPVPTEILSAEVTARSDNRGILRINLPKKAPTRQENKGRSIMVE
jgi:HSP20 family protein